MAKADVDALNQVLEHLQPTMPMFGKCGYSLQFQPKRRRRRIRQENRRRNQSKTDHA